MKKFLFILILIVLLISMINYFSDRHFTIVFKDVRPFDRKIPVYYKGIIVGKATDKNHSKDSLRTNVKITLYNKNLKLPLNTKALLKKRIRNDKETDYIELIYPKVPSERFISEHSHIHGHSTVDIKEYLKNQNIEDLEKIKSNLISSSENLNSTLEAFAGMFVLIQDILQENRENLKGSSKNIKESAQNINRMTKKFDNVIIEDQWHNTFNNIENTTGGFHNFAHNVNNTMTELDQTLPETFENTKNITSNINSITCGIKQTLSKKFGGLRLFFGRVIE